MDQKKPPFGSPVERVVLQPQAMARAWAIRFDVTVDDLTRAVKTAGDLPSDVARYFGKRWHRGSLQARAPRKDES